MPELPFPDPPLAEAEVPGIRAACHDREIPRGIHVLARDLGAE